MNRYFPAAMRLDKITQVDIKNAYYVTFLLLGIVCRQACSTQMNARYCGVMEIIPVASVSSSRRRSMDARYLLHTLSMTVYLGILLTVELHFSVSS